MEILKRKTETAHEILIDDYCQIAINDYGHLTIRYFNPNNSKVNAKKQITEDEDVIIVFEAAVTRKIMRFLRNLRVEDC